MVRIRPTGFAGKAFAGGIAKGFMDAGDARIAQANFERAVAGVQKLKSPKKGVHAL